MTSHVTVGDEIEAELKTAILIYSVDGGSGQSCATVHDVIAQKGAPVLAPGQPLKFSFLKELSRQLGVKSKRKAVELIPENVLMRGDAAVVWWTPARSCPMYFTGAAKESGVAELSGKGFPHPALLWVVSSRQLRVFALAQNSRPVASTKLYVAPYWNINHDCWVCLGSMRVPRELKLISLPVWEQSFFASNFTHANSDALTRHPGGFLGLWSSIEGGREFPVDMLMPTKHTIGSIAGELCTE